ncbi:beta-1,3-galactosyltransferase 1-like, partial [Oppia nitens]|uniref:beta-1,3-galactosyltransferase 1-like n=1 Tax=Oppia nitens TaxID=1686743 RepID=UPI0023DCA9EE
YVFAKRVGHKYSHNLSELELTKVVTIQQNKCSNHVIHVFVHSAAQTSGKYYDRRRVTRETWAKEAFKHNIKVVFVLAKPRNYSLQRDILIESNHFGDILQFDFIDDYHNLTLKAIGLLRWISLYCLSNDYVIKTDDDIVVNTERLRERIENKTFHSGITGKLFKYSKPIRDINNEMADKWLIPKEVFDEDYYPPYLSGAAYVISTDIINKLYKSAVNNTGPVLDIDDLYITGIIAQKYNIAIHDSPEFVLSTTNRHNMCGIEVCRMFTISTLHGCQSVNQTLQLWNKWMNTTMDSCHNYFVKLHRNTTSATIALIISLTLLITFIFSMIAMIIQYYANYRDLRWQKISTNA